MKISRFVTCILCCLLLMTQMTHAQKNVVYNTEDNIKVTFVVDEYDTPYYITVKGPSLSAAGVIIQTSHDRGKDENWNTYDDYRYCIYKEDDVNYLPDNDMTTPFNDDSSTCVTIRYVTINNVIKDRYITVTQGNNTLTSKVKHMSFKMTTNKKHNTK